MSTIYDAIFGPVTGAQVNQVMNSNLVNALNQSREVGKEEGYQQGLEDAQADAWLKDQQRARTTDFFASPAGITVVSVGAIIILITVVFFFGIKKK